MIYDSKTLNEILQGLEAEAAKSVAIINNAKADISTVEVKLKFIIATIHYLKNRYGDMKE